MKIALNLSTYSGSRERYALAWAVPLALAALVVFGVLSFHPRLGAVASFREYLKVHEGLVKLREQEAALRQSERTLREKIEQPQSREIYREAQFVNKLIERKRLSLTELTMKVAKLLPSKVRLTGLALSEPGSSPVVRFTVMGKNEEAVETFLGNLEDSPDFKDVAIINQGFEQQGTPGGQVIVACSALYLGAQTNQQVGENYGAKSSQSADPKH